MLAPLREAQYLLNNSYCAFTQYKHFHVVKKDPTKYFVILDDFIKFTDVLLP